MRSKGVITLLLLVAAVYLASPSRSYSVFIEAQPKGDQRFYLTTFSGRASFHGRDVNRVSQRFVLPNQKQKIELDTSQTQWFGSLGVNLYHPEYFFEIVSVEGWPLRQSVTIKPVPWIEALANAPTWSLEYPQYADRTEAFIAARQAHRVILLSDVHYHFVSLHKVYLDPYTRKGVNEPLKVSIDTIVPIIASLETGLYGDPDYGVRNVAYHRQQIREIHGSLTEIQQRIGQNE